MLPVLKVLVTQCFLFFFVVCIACLLYREAYTKGKKLTKRDFPEGADVPDAPMLPTKEERAVPEELACNLCHEIMKDCVLIPCCGLSFCDECKSVSTMNLICLFFSS